MIWFFVILGVCITLGGFCLCCGCVYCSDATTTATIQIDVGGIGDDTDNGSGCCGSLNLSYILDMDPANPCRFTKVFENGDCETDDCNACDSTDCTVGCDGSSTTTYCPPDGGAQTCPTTSGTVTYGGGCPNCEDTESGVINFAEGALIPEVCDCLCVVTALRWDVDVMIADHPEATWAVPNDLIWQCECTAKDCTAGVGKSSASISATIENASPGVRLNVSGNVTGGSFQAVTDISTDADIECAVEIDALDLSADLTNTPCVQPNCLCTLPTSLVATYLP